jgi:spore coat polysaccharide biosynthesis protein SpsF (cytidylyltransferase family)
MKILGVIQARLGSSRLQDKVLIKIGDKTMIEHVVERTRRLEIPFVVATGPYQKNGPLVVATGPYQKNGPLISHCLNIGAECFHPEYPHNGEELIQESNVLLRFILCGLFKNAKYILRIPADQPFFSVTYARELLLALEANEDNIDYYAHYLPDEEQPTIAKHPYGQFIELISLEALCSAYIHDENESHREDVTPFIYTSGRYRIRRIILKETPQFFLSVNTKEDLDRVRKYYRDTSD